MWPEIQAGDTTLSVEQWNREVLPRMEGREVLPGSHVQVQYHPQGTLLSLAPSAMWPHPWFTTVAWDRDLEKWTARTLAGFVNGLDPVLHLMVDEKPEDADLRADPSYPLNHFRDVSSPFPQFFKQLGVRAPVSNIVLTANGVAIDQTQRAEEDTPPRFLKACEAWVSVARPTLQMNADITGNVILGQIVDYSLSYDLTALNRAGSRARLQHGGEMPKSEPPTFTDKIQGVYSDDGEDRHKIFTAWFLSPPEAEVLPGPPPGDWTPFIQHHTFWNLSHAAPLNPPVQSKQTPLDPGTAAFVGRYTVAPAATLGAQQAEFQRLALAALNAEETRGYFWLA